MLKNGVNVSALKYNIRVIILTTLINKYLIIKLIYVLRRNLNV